MVLKLQPLESQKIMGEPESEVSQAQLQSLACCSVHPKPLVGPLISGATHWFPSPSEMLPPAMGEKPAGKVSPRYFWMCGSRRCGHWSSSSCWQTPAACGGTPPSCISFGAETKHISNKSQKQNAAHQRETVLFSKRRIAGFLSATILRPNLYHRQDTALGLCSESQEVTKQPPPPPAASGDLWPEWSPCSCQRVSQEIKRPWWRTCQVQVTSGRRNWY